LPPKILRGSLGTEVFDPVSLEELEVEPVVFDREIGLLAVVPALGDVVRNTWQNQARQSGHIDIVGIYPQKFSGVV
ncbi:MAG: hypothetical protein KJZ84_11305, partial [Bryobacteraceae bacterium]|nr:hypothetical protein [Bryobacteraceae bacterium]